MKIKNTLTLLTLLNLSCGINAAPKAAPKRATKETTETTVSNPPVAPAAEPNVQNPTAASTKSKHNKTPEQQPAPTAAVTAEPAPRVPTPNPVATAVVAEEKPEDENNEMFEGEEDPLAKQRSSRAFVRPTTLANETNPASTATPTATTNDATSCINVVPEKTSAKPPLPGRTDDIADWDFAALPPEQQRSLFASLIEQVRRTANDSVENWRTIAVALKYHTHLHRLNYETEPTTLATTIAAMNQKNPGDGTTIAINACREAIHSKNTGMVKSIVSALTMLNLIKEMGATDKEAIDKYARNMVTLTQEAMEEELNASADVIRQFAAISREVIPSGRNTPPATDEELATLSKETARMIQQKASVKRF